MRCTAKCLENGFIDKMRETEQLGCLLKTRLGDRKTIDAGMIQKEMVVEWLPEKPCGLFRV
jgi:hypothetical protein